MKVELKTWTGLGAQLGLATALAGLTLSGCAEEADEGRDGDLSEQVGESGEGEGIGGEGEGRR